MDGLRFTKLDSLEWKIKLELERQGVSSCRCVVAVSGGLDSACLLFLVSQLSSRLKLEIHVCNIFHGQSSDLVQNEFRYRSWQFVRARAGELGAFFHSNEMDPIRSQLIAPTNEAGLRQLRKAYLEELVQSLDAQWLILGHQQDDVVETQLLRLIRGTGPQGFYSALPSRRGFLIRPLLGVSRSELREYAQKHRLEWLDDPSNDSMEPLRNWLRNQWLPLLEKRRPGSRRRLAQSLALLGEALEKQTIANVLDCATHEGIKLPLFLELNSSDQRRALARYMNLVGIKNYTRAHIDEIIKRLRNSRREMRFEMARSQWHVNAERISARRRNS